MRRLYYRTVKDNKIKLLGKTLSNVNLKNGELDGKRFCFIPYSGETGFAKDGLTALWGTERLSKALRKDVTGEELKLLTTEHNKILAPDGYFNWYFWKEVK